jgi:hypothetical protein
MNPTPTDYELIRRALQAIHERTNMAKQFVFLFTCGFTLDDLEAIYQGCRLCASDDGSVLDAQWSAAKERIAKAIKPSGDCT